MRNGKEGLPLETSTLFTEIRTKYNTFSAAQKIIANYVLENSEKVILLTISDLAAACNTSETTILRFLHKLGYNSYQVFRVKMAQDIGMSSNDQLSHTVYEEIITGDDIASIKRKVILSTIASIQDLSQLLSDESIEAALELLFHANRVYFYGAGASASIASDAFHKFSRLGLNCFTTSDSHMISILASHTNEHDIIFYVSHSGESREVLDSSALARACGCKIIAMTSYPHSSAAQMCDVCLLSSTNETKYRSDAMVSRIVQLCIIDILQVALILRMGETGLNNLNTSRLAVAKMKT